MITGLHILLTYNCNFACDHCFLYSGPEAKGTFTIAMLKKILSEIPKIGSIEWMYFEGGEPFLYYPLMLRGVRIAKEAGLKAGIVTNAYWAETVEDALIWLEPLKKLGIDGLSLSDDSYHYDDTKISFAKIAQKAANKLGIPVDTICIEKPAIEFKSEQESKKNIPTIQGNTMFRSRAVDKLIHGLPRKNWKDMKTCPFEKLDDPGRVHIDPYGNVHLCQGLLMGNIIDSSLHQIVNKYSPKEHPICGPILDGGPALLSREYGIDIEDQYVDECHMCFEVRKSLMAKYPRFLGPKQVYSCT
jgi:organic radical activating enzyme